MIGKQFIRRVGGFPVRLSYSIFSAVSLEDDDVSDPHSSVQFTEKSCLTSLLKHTESESCHDGDVQQVSGFSKVSEDGEIDRRADESRTADQWYGQRTATSSSCGS